MKQGTPFYIYGRARDGSVVAYQLSGRICPKHLSAHGVKQVGLGCFGVAWNEGHGPRVWCAAGRVWRFYVLTLSLSLWVSC